MVSGSLATESSIMVNDDHSDHDIHSCYGHADSWQSYLRMLFLWSWSWIIVIHGYSVNIYAHHQQLMEDLSSPSPSYAQAQEDLAPALLATTPSCGSVQIQGTQWRWSQHHALYWPAQQSKEAIAVKHCTREYEERAICGQTCLHSHGLARSAPLKRSSLVGGCFSGHLRDWRPPAGLQDT